MSIADTGHSHLMDRVYRNQRHIYDLTRRYYLLGRDRLIAGLGARPGMRVLEVGCGTGRNLISALRRFPQAEFYGMDISSEMLATARAAACKARLEQRVSFAQGDATDFDPERAFGIRKFERVFMSYTVSMIPEWRRAVEQAMRNVAPGGSLHIVDFGQQEGLPRFFRALLFAWLGWFHVSPRADLREALGEIAAAHDATLDFQSLHRGYSWLAVLKRPA
ncbi:methyltransferase domain-containing protein [Parvibaculum sedimenti]|uniref:Methyltransferase domain-containing protein n=3 Tax=Parvibaculum sedimenti TaxID=2608632 RepID=A0A6N6VKA6_9HYPH|nr:class I SAM-dependent methyltransferase [Parvibaculum sedimenti]KAB7741679.1 methyltransferase domain-containing protein [Parvibaculum sedimenti]